MRGFCRTCNLTIWGTPYRPWWTYLGRERRWRYALTLALASVLALEGCSTCGDMSRRECEQLNGDLKKTETASPASAVPYDYGAGKKPALWAK